MDDSLHVKVTKAKGGAFGRFVPGEIEEDTWHRAKLLRIDIGEQSFKGVTSPAWIWVYELLGDEFTYTDTETKEVGQYIVIERTSQKFTSAPRESKAFKRNKQLTGDEPEAGDDVNLKDLFGTVCKLMIRNTAGDKITFHNIEKISIKGIKAGTVKKETTPEEPVEEIEETTTEKKKTKTKTKKETRKGVGPVKSETPEADEEEDIFSELF